MMINLVQTNITDVKILEQVRHEDERGYFSEIWRQRDLTALDASLEFVQDNIAYSRLRGTIRGLHLQVGPEGMGKLVTVLRGAVLDVAVDVRRGSSSYARHVLVELSEANGRQLWVPPGFAHGYCTLLPDTLVFYKQTAFYDPTLERGIRWDDPTLALPWPDWTTRPVLSERDRNLPSLQDFEAGR